MTKANPKIKVNSIKYVLFDFKGGITALLQ